MSPVTRSFQRASGASGMRDVDRLHLDVWAAALESRRGQEEESNLQAGERGAVIDVDSSAIQELYVRLRGQNGAEAAKKAARLLRRFATEDDKVEVILVTIECGIFGGKKEG